MAIRYPFNLPWTAGPELDYIRQAIENRKISGNGAFTQHCHALARARWGFHKTLLTTSCTDALEMCALLLDIQPGDEVVLPAYTFVSTANPFLLRGARLVFADSRPEEPNLDPEAVRALLTPRTRAVVVVHYGGAACDMDAFEAICGETIALVEDAAHAIDAVHISPSHGRRPLGAIGRLAAFSFHETKNLSCGEGGMLVVNDPQYAARAEILWEKGTNRAAFFRGEVDKYGWVDVGSSFLLSDLNAAFLLAQLEAADEVQRRRVAVWHAYREALAPLEARGDLRLPVIPPWAEPNGHLFYVVTHDLATRDALTAHLRTQGIQAVFHYLALHQSPFFRARHDGRPLPNAERFTDTLLRLPFYNALTEDDVAVIAGAIGSYFR